MARHTGLGTGQSDSGIGAVQSVPSVAIPSAIETDLDEINDDILDLQLDMLSKATDATRSASTLGIAIHGVTAAFPRPTGYASVLWLGSVTPTNSANNDVWIDTT